MKIPYGYQLINGKLAVNESEQRVLSIVRKYKELGLSLRKIANILSQHGIRSRNGWTIYELLSN